MNRRLFKKDAIFGERKRHESEEKMVFIGGDVGIFIHIFNKLFFVLLLNV